MRPIGLVEQFHKLFRTIGFDLFGFLNLQIMNFKDGSSTEFPEEFEIRKFPPLDNVEIYDRWGLSVSDTVRAGK